MIRLPMLLLVASDDDDDARRRNGRQDENGDGVHVQDVAGCLGQR